MVVPKLGTDEFRELKDRLGLWRREQRADGITKTVSAESALSSLAKMIGQSKLESLIPLASLLQLKGKSFSLKNHFPMEPLFSLNVPPRLLVKTGRQVSKSTSLAAQGVLMTARIPFFSTIFVTPLYEQIRRFSSNYVRPFLKKSLIGSILTDTKTEDSVLQKTFLNESRMYFTFAFLDVDRARGLPGDKLVIDEVQDMDADFIPILEESLSASDWGVQQYSGTPKTMDNAVQTLWEDSSQAEWVMKCHLCGHWNVPNLDGGILKMIHESGLVCSKCEKPGLNPVAGHWQHMYPDNYARFAAYHVPQIILPMHYNNEEKWLDLYEKKIKRSPATFMNEVLGESCDIGTKLITLSDLKKASQLPHSNEYEKARQYASERSYIRIVMGVDWGGGGLKEVSFTAVAVSGLLPNGRVETIHVHRIKQGYKYDEEASMLLKIYWDFKCSVFAHDFGGAGAVREAVMITAGLTERHIMPCLYVRAKGGPMLSHKKGKNDVRNWYSLDKARSLMFITSLIRSNGIHFPQYETCKEELGDFLSLIEDKSTTRLGDIFVITKNPKSIDDVAHAVNYSCIALFHVEQRWPALAKRFEINANLEALTAADPRLTGESGYDPYAAISQ